jgi:LPS-assembly lipoprotein
MSWPDLPFRARARVLARLAVVLGVAGLAAGCFQPMYGERSIGGDYSVASSLRSVRVEEVKTTPGSNNARVGVQLRNDLIFELTGGAGEGSPTHKLTISIVPTVQQVIVNIASGRTDTQNYGLDVYYQLVDLATGKTVVNSTTFSRVSFNIPGEQQRFAGERGLRDAENRAAHVAAEQIRNRLASYFTAGT